MRYYVLYTHVCVYICIYIYAMCVHRYVYVHTHIIYIYRHMCIYIYIYVYIYILHTKPTLAQPNGSTGGRGGSPVGDPRAGENFLGPSIRSLGRINTWADIIMWDVKNWTDINTRTSDDTTWHHALGEGEKPERFKPPVAKVLRWVWERNVQVCWNVLKIL